MDGLPEFRRNVLEVLRQPLEDAEVTISRASLSLTYPARFMHVSPNNPLALGSPCELSHERMFRCGVPPRPHGAGLFGKGMVACESETVT